MELRIGVLGLGKMGLLHAATLNGLPGARVVAAADPSSVLRKSLSEMGARFPLFESFEEMLGREKLDAVVITTPVANHVPSAELCVERGLPFLLEKPLSTTAESARALVRRLRERPVPHMVGYMTRFIEAFQEGKRVVASGALGRLHQIRATIYVSQLFATGRGWRYDRKTSGGGALLSQGSHLLDLLLWYFGPAKRVNGSVFSAYSAEIEDFAHLMIEFESGALGWFDCSWSVRFHRTVATTIEVTAENGTLVVTDDTVRLFMEAPRNGYPQGWTIRDAVELYRGVEFDVGGPQYGREALAFLECVRNRAMGSPNVFDAFRVQQLVDAAYRSAAISGAPQLLGESA